MREIFQFTLPAVLAASLILQLFAVFLGFRLMRISRNGAAWILLFVAMMFMAARRSVMFFHVLTGGANHFADVLAELIAFFISLLLVAGLLSITGLMRRYYSLSDETFTSPLGELFEKTTSGVAIYTPVDGGRDFIITDMNPVAERIEKLTREHAIGRRLTEMFPSIEEFGLMEVLRRVLKTGRPENFPLHYYQDDRISGWRDNFVYRRPAGELVAVYSDVSVQMRMQEELERRERKFRVLFEKAPLPYQVLDGEGRILEVNPAWLRLTGLQHKDMTGRSFSELLSHSGRQRFSDALGQLQKQGTITDLPLEMIRKEGGLLNVEMTALAQTGRSGGIEQIYCMLDERDGSGQTVNPADGVERQAKVLALEMQSAGRRELQQQRLSMFGDLIGGLVHELNPPLTAARNAFNLMRQDLSPASPHYEFAGIAARELSRMVDLVEQMYRFHNPISQDCEAVSINAMLDNSLILVQRMVKERDIQVKDERASVVPLVLLPPGAVMLALINPIRNSLEAMPSGGIMTLRSGAFAERGVFVEIEDNGVGIPEDFLPRLFEPFTALRHSGRSGGGTGLGMAQVQHTLNMLGGSVEVESRVGEGTCVRIVFPDRIKSDA